METATMTQLPSEIKARICHYLCSHCYDPLSLGFHHQDFPDHAQAKKALAALCAASKSWNAAACPYLYHILHVPSRRDRSWEELARTLLKNRSLARHVTSFDQEAVGSPDWTKAVDGPGELGFVDKRGDHVLLLPLILACANNLQHLNLEIGDGNECWDNKQWESLLFRLRSMGIYGSGDNAEPQPFSQIKTLEIGSHYEWGYAITFPIVLAVVAGAGPSLEHLIISNVTGSEWDDNGGPVDEIQTPQLKVLNFAGSAISSADEQAMQILKQFCQTSTQLEEFHFRGQSAYIGESLDQHATAVHFLKGCLLACRETLKVLTLDLSHFSWCMDQQASLAVVKGDDSLSNFTKLEKLSIEDFSFCLHRFELDKEEREEMPHTCLTGVLPASIRHLVLRMSYAEPNESGESSDRGVWGDIIELVRQAATKGGSFPNLRQIDIMFAVEEDHGYMYRSYEKIEEPIDVWMAAELERQTKALDVLCQGTDIQYSIKRVNAL